MGAIDVPADKYWGAQTQRSLIHFSIGDDKMAKAVYHAYGYVKKAAAIVNGRARRLPAWKADLIERVAREVIAGKLDEHFPLYVADRSGTQSNMNVNEVIRNRAIQLVGGRLGSKTPVHPNDHVNMGKLPNEASGAALRPGELILPANEPGSSIMPGKVNPTQCEAIGAVGEPFHRHRHTPRCCRLSQAGLGLPRGTRFHRRKCLPACSLTTPAEWCWLTTLISPRTGERPAAHRRARIGKGGTSRADRQAPPLRRSFPRGRPIRPDLAQAWRVLLLLRPSARRRRCTA